MDTTAPAINEPVDSGTAPAPLLQHQAAAWVDGFAEGWRAPTGADAFVEHFGAMLAPDIRLLQPQLPAVVGHDAFREQFARPLFALMPDLHAEVERWASSGETLYIELTLKGTLAGRPVCWRLCDRVTLRDDLAVERESYFDPGPLLWAVARTPRAWLPFARLRARGRRLAAHTGSAR